MTHAATPSIAAPGVLLEAENPVKQIKPLPMPKLSVTQEDLDRELTRIGTRSACLLPIESSDEHRKEISQAIRRLQQAKLDLLFPRLDPSFMTWRHKDGWPSLAIFSLESPSCEFVHEPEGPFSIMRSEHDMSRYWPERFKEKYYADVYQKLERLAREEYAPDHLRGCARISAKFSGILPEKTKDKLEGLKEHFGKQMFVVREAPEWEVDTWAVPLNFDPLLVGVYGEGFWLLDDFDLTPLERIIKSEFSTGPQKA